jgi:uncharacterized protein YcbK (DUF882 family)
MIKCPYCIDAELKRIDYSDEFGLYECPDCDRHIKKYNNYETLKKYEQKQITEYFTMLELCCKHCLQQGILTVVFDINLVRSLTEIRGRLGLPIYFNSFYRCPKHNKQVGGAVNSFHMQGKAADIRIGKLTLAVMWAILEKEKFNGMGSYPDAAEEFIHLDIGERYTRFCRRKGIYYYLF